MKVTLAVLCATLCLIGAFLACGGGANTPAPMSTISGFQQTNLVSDAAGTAKHTDPGLLNPWGVAFLPGQPFWIADNNRGTAKVFDPSGAPDIPSVVRIPTPSGSVYTGVRSSPRIKMRGCGWQTLRETDRWIVGAQTRPNRSHQVHRQGIKQPGRSRGGLSSLR